MVKRPPIGQRAIKALEEVRDFLDGKPTPGLVVHHAIDVAAIRKKTGLSQTEFAARFGLDVAAVRDWEQGRRVPERSARVLLRVIDSEPDAVVRANKVAEGAAAGFEARKPAAKKAAKSKVKKRG